MSIDEPGPSALLTYRQQIERFIDSGVGKHTLGLVYGRRRIGKSTLLETVTSERGGFYWEATRGESPVQLSRLGETVGAFIGGGRLAFQTWEEAVHQLLRLGEQRSIPVVLDEFGYVLEADPSVDSIISSMLGPRNQRINPGQSRLILCGSAISILRSLTAGQAPLRGRAGIELIMQPFNFREAAQFLGPKPDLELATWVYAVIGGVVGYATDMVDYDLPDNTQDFERWIVTRLLSPAATLHHEAVTLLAEDPTLTAANPVIHHSILGAIANGSVTAGTIASKLQRSVSSLDPALKRLIEAGFVVRHEDPIRSQRPTYALADPFLQFYYAILEPHSTLWRHPGQQTTWRGLGSTFGSRVRGPVFEEQARTWVLSFAAPSTLGELGNYIGPSVVTVNGKERQLDVVVASGDSIGTPPAERTVHALGEAKAGETIGHGHLKLLEQVRAGLGSRAAAAKLLLFAPTFTRELLEDCKHRSDVELIDLHRLYHGD